MGKVPERKYSSFGYIFAPGKGCGYNRANGAADQQTGLYKGFNQGGYIWARLRGKSMVYG